MNEKLSEGLKKLSLDFSTEQIGQLETYCSCVLEFNKTYNLMKAENEDELYVNHVLDSLAACSALEKFIKDGTQVGDIGSGGGCPGIPLAVAFPMASFTLVERMEKRCAFLEGTVKTMGLKNVRILCRQVDLVDPEIFDVEVFRAFHPFDKKITKWLLKMLRKGGTVASYKAREEKILAEMEEIKFLVPEYERIKLTVPFLEDHERNLVVFGK